jgi:hypothetical protein
MRKAVWIGILAITAAATWQIGGCGGLLPTIPLSISLGGNADFDVESGVPSTKTFSRTFSNDSGVDIGSGSMAVDASAITVTPDQAKTLQGIPETCGDACDLAGVPSATCNSVCNLGQVVVTVWVGAADEEDPQATGDEYGPYMVTLDGEANPVSIEPNSVQLQPKTIQAINDGEANVTVEVVSPFSGVVTLNSIRVNAGL